MKQELRHCRNCNEPLHGKYCSACGQEDTAENIRLKSIFADVIDDYFTVDSKIITSLKPLLFKPGYLSMEYFSGRRVGYVKPFRIYIISSLVFFFLFFMQQNSFVIEDTDSSPADPITNVDSNAVEIVTADELSDDITADSLDSETDADSTEVLAFLGRKFESRLSRFEDMETEAINAEIGSYFRNNLPKVMFVLLPVYALLLQLLFRRKRAYYLEHFIVSLHVHSFAFIIFSVSILLGMPGNESGFLYWLDTVWEVLIPFALLIYAVKNMRVVYDQTWMGAMGKTIVLSFMYMLCVLVTMLLTVLGALLYA